MFLRVGPVEPVIEQVRGSIKVPESVLLFCVDELGDILGFFELY